jgi:cysteine desulfuration protein SufE
MGQQLPGKLGEIVEEFQWCEGREKLELLIQFAENMPSLPAWLEAKRAEMDSVPECMTPVSVFVENQAGHLMFFFDVPVESPLVRGFAAIMKQGLDDATPEDVLRVPADFYLQMGLEQVLTHQRLNGLSAILAHMKQLALKNIAQV